MTPTRGGVGVESPTSLTWLGRLTGGGTDADWRRLTDVYAPLLRRWAARTGVAADAIDDVTQEVLVAVVRGVGAFDHRGHGSFRAWLRGILANQVRRHIRERAAHPEVDLDAVADPASELGARWDREHDEHLAGRALVAVRVDFSDQTWQAFRRQVIDGVPVAEVARELGASANVVLCAKNRVLRRLREELSGLLAD